MSNIVTSTAKKLVERVCDRLKSDVAKVWVYSVYYITTAASVVTLAIIYGADIMNLLLNLLVGAA